MNNRQMADHILERAIRSLCQGRPRDTFLLFRVLLIVTVGLLVIVGCGESVEPEECIQDEECAKKQFQFDAEYICAKAVEGRANYAHRWTNGFAEGKFYSFFPRTAAKEIIISGNKVQFQNAFGAWQNMSYTCTYDPIKERVKSLQVS